MKNNGLQASNVLLSYFIALSILLSSCGGTPTAQPPNEVPPNPVSGDANGNYVNILINSVEFKGKVSNLGDTGNLQLIIVVSDDSGHADALICPYGGVTKVHQGDNINPCKAGLTYPEDILQGNLYVMLIAMDVKDSSTFADIGTNVITAGLSTGLGFAIQGTSAPTPQLAIGLIALSAIIGYAGTKTQEYFQKNYVIGSQSFALSPEYHWNNGQPVNAASTNGEVNFIFRVQNSSSAEGKLVDSVPSQPEVSNNIPANNTSSNSTSNSQPSTSPDDPEQFVRSYFYSLAHDKEYQTSWDLLTPAFQNKNSPDGYDEYVKFWKKIDSVDINSIEFYEHIATSAKCRVNITFHANDTSETVDVKYHLIYDSSRNTWMFESP